MTRVKASLTWAEMTRIEPGLAALLRDADEVRDDGGPVFCANAVWYAPGGLKERLVRLVGWFARDARLKSNFDYDAAYERVYDALPVCRGCCCIVWP